MKKNEALAVVESRIMSGDIPIESMKTIGDIEASLRLIANRDGGVRNALFEYAVHKIAKELLK